jgi:acetyl esterase
MLRRTFLGATVCGVIRGQSRFSRPPNIADIAYDRFPRNVLDLWQADSARPTPLVIYIQSGLFNSGDKSELDPAMLDQLLSSGISVAAINHRYSGTHGPSSYPFVMWDGIRAVQFLRYRAAIWNLDFARFGATGSSSGAGMALWIAFNHDFENRQSGDPVKRCSSRLCAVAGVDAQTTYDPEVIASLVGVPATRDPALGPFYGMYGNALKTEPARQLLEDASAVTHLTAGAPPVLLIYTEPDKPVPANAAPGTGIHHPRFGYYLKERMDKLKIECTVVVMDKPGAEKNPTDLMVDFFRRHLLEVI